MRTDEQRIKYKSYSLLVKIISYVSYKVSRLPFRSGDWEFTNTLLDPVIEWTCRYPYLPICVKGPISRQIFTAPHSYIVSEKWSEINPWHPGPGCILFGPRYIGDTTRRLYVPVCCGARAQEYTLQYNTSTVTVMPTRPCSYSVAVFLLPDHSAVCTDSAQNMHRSAPSLFQ